MKTNLLSLLIVVFAFFGGQKLFSQFVQDNLYFEFFSYCQAPVNVEIEVESKNLASGANVIYTYCTTILPGNNKLMDFETSKHDLVYAVTMRVIHPLTGIAEISPDEVFPVIFSKDSWALKMNKKKVNTLNNNYYAYNLTDGYFE